LTHFKFISDMKNRLFLKYTRFPNPAPEGNIKQHLLPFCYDLSRRII